MSRLNDYTQIHTLLVGLLWTSDQPDDKDLCLTAHNSYKRQTSMPPAGFEPAVPADERPKTHSLDRAANGFNFSSMNLPNKIL
jgi:hypothetical protein